MKTVSVVTKKGLHFFTTFNEEATAIKLFNHFVTLQRKHQPFVFTIANGIDKTVKSIPENAIVSVNRTSLNYTPGLRRFKIIDVNLNLENNLSV